MKNQDDIIKKLSSFIDFFESLAQKDPLGLYTRSHDDLIMYKGVRDALKMPPPPPQPSLVNGF
jgi:hypothetical protein